ncbi:hypothetical protein B0J15DRAFT_411065, partial [Fusarium solani]
ETKCHNQRTGKEEWRCKHYNRTYAYSRGTMAPIKYLMDRPLNSYSLLKGVPRIAKVIII